MNGQPGHAHPLSASDLTVHYPPHASSPACVALHGVSFQIAINELVAVVGGTGSGKTTLARVLSGDFMQRDVTRRQGRVRPVIVGGQAAVLGQQLRGISRRRAARIASEVAYLSQDAASWLPPDRTVVEIIAQPVLARNRHQDRQALASRVLTLIDAVRLPLGVAESYPYQLSAGQRQRVALARSLVLRPTILIADEPTAGVDPTVRTTLIQLITELRQWHPFSAMILSQELGVLREMVDRVAVLESGVLTALGTVDAVLDRADENYLSRLLQFTR